MRRVNRALWWWAIWPWALAGAGQVAEEPRFIPGEVIVKFQPGSRTALAVERAEAELEKSPEVLRALAEVGILIGVPLRPRHLTSGEELVLELKGSKMIEDLVRGKQEEPPICGVVPIASQPTIEPAPRLYFRLEGDADGKCSQQAAELGRTLGLRLESAAAPGEGHLLSLDLHALTLTVVERLERLEVVEYAQPNYILDLF